MRPSWLAARLQLPALPPSSGQNGCENDSLDRSHCEQSMHGCHQSISVMDLLQYSGLFDVAYVRF